MTVTIGVFPTSLVASDWMPRCGIGMLDAESGLPSQAGDCSGTETAADNALSPREPLHKESEILTYE